MKENSCIMKHEVNYMNKKTGIKSLTNSKFCETIHEVDFMNKKTS